MVSTSLNFRFDPSKNFRRVWSTEYGRCFHLVFMQGLQAEERRRRMPLPRHCAGAFHYDYGFLPTFYPLLLMASTVRMTPLPPVPRVQQPARTVHMSTVCLPLRGQKLLTHAHHLTTRAHMSSYMLYMHMLLCMHMCTAAEDSYYIAISDRR